MRFPAAFILLLLAVRGLAGEAPATREIPCEFVDGLVLIHAQAAGSTQPLSMVLDSGASASVLRLETAERLRARMGPPVGVRGIDAQAEGHRLAPIALKAGGVPLGACGLAIEMPSTAEICTRPIDGLIGADFFKNRIVRIDYPRHRLCILSRDPGTGEVLPLRLSAGVLCVPVRVNGSAPRWTRLDTGCNDALHWVVPRTDAGQARLGVSIGLVTNEQEETLATITLGGRTLEHVETALHGRPIFDGEAGLLGSGVLGRYCVTVNGISHTVALAEQ